TGDFRIRGPRCGEGILAKSELSHRGLHDCRDWRKAVWPLLDRSSEAFIVLCDPPQHVLGYSAFYCFRENAQLFCTRSPRRRIIVVTQAHISKPVLDRKSWSSVDHLFTLLSPRRPRPTFHGMRARTRRK